MNRLSALDASFIYGETPETPMNVGSLAKFAAMRRASSRLLSPRDAAV